MVRQINRLYCLPRKYIAKPFDRSHPPLVMKALTNTGLIIYCYKYLPNLIFAPLFDLHLAFSGKMVWKRVKVYYRISKLDKEFL